MVAVSAGGNRVLLARQWLAPGLRATDCCFYRRPPVQTMAPVRVVHTPRACWCRIHLSLSVSLSVCVSPALSLPPLSACPSLSHFLSPLLLSLSRVHISNLYTHPPSRCSNSRNYQPNLPKPRIDILKTSISFFWCLSMEQPTSDSQILSVIQLLRA